MSKFGYIIFVLALFFAPAIAFAVEFIPAFTSHIEINKNGSVSVQEEIVYDFGAEEKHGILREIPLLYEPTSAFPHRIQITSISITDGHNSTRQAEYDQAGNGNVAVLKIGDKDVLLTGPQLYVIRYTIWGAIESGAVGDKFTYDVTGSSLQVPISKIRAEIILPGEFTFDTLDPTCGRGAADTWTPCTASSSVGLASTLAHMLRFEDTNFAPKEGMMVSFALPKGTIIFQQKASDKLIKGTVVHSGIYRWWQRPFLNFTLAIPFLVFAAMLSILYSEKQQRGKKRVQHVGRGAYFITGLVLIGISFYVPTLNLAFLLSGIVIVCFSVFFDKAEKNA